MTEDKNVSRKMFPKYAVLVRHLNKNDKTGAYELSNGAYWFRLTINTEDRPHKEKFKSDRVPFGQIVEVGTRYGHKKGVVLESKTVTAEDGENALAEVQHMKRVLVITNDKLDDFASELTPSIYNYVKSPKKQKKYTYQSSKIINKTLLPYLGMTVKYRYKEPQMEKYEGFYFKMFDISFRNRLAKKTPVRKGYSVSLYERDENDKKQAFDMDSSSDITLINIVDGMHQGQFLFPKTVLLKHGILRKSGVKGKMTLRVYPSWETGLNAAALKELEWQTDYFVDLSNDQEADMEVLERIIG